MKNKSSGLAKKLVLAGSITLASLGSLSSNSNAYDILSDPANPANPSSPLSPSNPANPASPLNPMNQSKLERPLTDKEKDLLRYSLYGAGAAMALILGHYFYKTRSGNIF